VTSDGQFYRPAEPFIAKAESFRSAQLPQPGWLANVDFKEFRVTEKNEVSTKSFSIIT
jgi:hypothetical protein